MKIFKKLALGVTLACAAWASTSMAATEADKLAAINAGLAHLAATQQVDGSWSFGSYNPAATGASLLAFMSQKSKWGANAAAYTTIVNKAVAYLISDPSGATKISVSTRNNGINICPGAVASCDGVFWNASSDEDSYTTGLIIPGLVEYVTGFGIPLTNVPTAVGQLAGLTWAQIFQANINLWAASQSTVNQGALKGGWRYHLGGGSYDSDMSTTQWGIISLIYSESVGATTPAIVKTDLDAWLLHTQAASGAGCYDGSNYCAFSDTGGMLLGLKYVGVPNSNARVANAITWLNANWQQTANGTWYGNFGHPYAMWGVYKGLQTSIGTSDNTHILNLRPIMCDGASGYPGIPPNVANCNWWQDYNDWLVTNQNANGSWSGYSYWTDPLSTAFDITILSAIQINIIQCDVTGGQNVPDGFVDKLDLALISKSRGQAPVPPKDVFDTNKDGVINAEDVKICIPKCTLANCAITPVGTQPK